MSFYIVEGPNGSGKTTAINKMRERSKNGEPIVALSSPGETELGKMLRPACRGVSPWEHLDPKIQFMLFSSVRYDEYLKIVHNSLNTCIADRWWTSTYVYQCMYGNISVDFLEHTVHKEEKINGVFLLDGDPDTLISRAKEEREKNNKHGVCTWTQEEESMRAIISLYKNELPSYLRSKNIPITIIDVVKNSHEDVDKIIMDKITEDKHE